MSETTSNASEEVPADVEAMIEQAGGHEAFVKSWREYDELFREFVRKEKWLRQQYPDQFVALARGDVLVVGDTREEVRRRLDEKGIAPGQAIIDFLDVNSGWTLPPGR